MNTFKDNLYDLAYNMATRYKGKVAFWAIWNEPNIAYAFSPQDLNAGVGYLTNEYMELIQFPAHGAITAVTPAALTVGPELATPDDGGNAKEHRRCRPRGRSTDERVNVMNVALGPQRAGDHPVARSNKRDRKVGLLITARSGLCSAIDYYET
jgi:hypothetical protein